MRPEISIRQPQQHLIQSAIIPPPPFQQAAVTATMPIHVSNQSGSDPNLHESPPGVALSNIAPSSSASKQNQGSIVLL
jgi:hypothetical protein